MGLSAEVRQLFRLPDATAADGLEDLVVSLGEAIAGLDAVDVTGVEPGSGVPLVRGWGSAV